MKEDVVIPVAEVLSGYTLTGEMGVVDRYVLHRAIRNEDRRPVLLKVPAVRHPSQTMLCRLEHEYAVACELGAAWSLRPLKLERQAGVVALVYEDVGGRLLSAGLNATPMPVPEVLDLVWRTATALAELHRRGLVHKDIRPENLLVREDGSVRLTGFGIASRLPREHQPPGPPEEIAGTPAYMAPEQTGRMNRSVDARSDLYALGVTLYRLLTGVLPFNAVDSIGWVHCHIAGAPINPEECVPGLPGPLCAIVMKLLSKAGEDRYQTAAGLAADLQRCRRDWKADGKLTSFALGANDVSDRLVIPEKLYGREREIAALLAGFDRVVATGTPEFVLISGYSGVGKTSVVSELHRTLVPTRGLFAAGKFDRLNRDIPYATLGQAFQAVVRQILVRSDVEVGRWREAVREAVGPNGRLLVELIPALGWLIGEQPPVPEVPSRDAQNRFQRVFRQFLSVFARPEHPLVLFLDDLQWIDAATLNLLRHLMTQPEIGPLLLIGAFRDNEVNPSHPLMLTLAALHKAGTTRMREIALAPLALDDVARLVTDALHDEPGRTRLLARLIHEKTAGNPFFVVQFLMALADENLLVFDSGSQRWVWELSRLQARNYTDNVVELMVGKLKRLGEVTHEAIKRLACLGNTAGFPVLRLLQGGSESALHESLWEAVREGLIERREGVYAFVHDRVQEAAYSLVPEASRAEAHLRIGRLLAAGMNAGDLDEHLFEIVGHFNRGAALIHETSEKERVAELNLNAGRKAKASTAYASARVYLGAGVALLDDEGWEHRHALMFDLWLELAECECMSSEFEATGRHLAVLMSRAASNIEHARVCRLKIEMHILKSENPQAIESALECLRRFDIDLTTHRTWAQVEREHAAVREGLSGRSIESLIHSPVMTDPEARAAMQILGALVPAAYFTDVTLYSLLACHMARRSVEHGATGTAAYAYGCFGLMLAGAFHHYVDAWRFAKLGCDLVEKHGFTGEMPRVYIVSGLVAYWTQPLSHVLALQHSAFVTAMETGDLVMACYSRLHALMTRHLQGESLDALGQESEKVAEFTRQVGFRDLADVVEVQKRFIARLQGRPVAPCTLGDESLDEATFEARLNPSRKSMLFWWHWVLKLQEAFLFGDYRTALQVSAQTELLMGQMVSQTARLLDYHTFTALAIAGLYEHGTDEERSGWRARLTTHGEVLDEWAAIHPSTFGDKAALIRAETARIDGRNEEAMRLYEDAIDGARKNGFVHYEAIANELASRFHARRSFKTIAQAYLKEARHAYVRWGATGKVKQLEAHYPWLEEPAPKSDLGVIAASPERLDLMTVIKAAQAISGELDADRLAETLLRIALENAGAQTGYLFIEPDAGVFAATSPKRRDGGVDSRRLESASAADVPTSIIHYVKRTGETVILADASTGGGDFSGDRYLRRTRPRSVFCMPILRQARLVGLLYLENNLATGAFTPERRAVLDMIASQAAISLEIARLYADLQCSQAQLQAQTRILQSILDSLGEGVSVANEHGEIILRNPAAGSILAIPPAKGPPDTWTAHYGMYLPDEVTPLLATDMPLVRAVRGESVDNVEVFMKHAGRPQGAWLNFTARPLTDNTGGHHGGVIVFSDITARKRAEQEIRALNAELEQRVIDRTRKLEAANKELESFSYSVSHDLRAPLRSIAGFSRILEEDYSDKLDDEGREHLVRIRAATRHMSQLIEDMLLLSRVTRTELRRAPVDLSALARAVCEELRKSDPQRPVELVIEPELTAQADGPLMRIVFVNLLGNAWKFTGHQSAPRIEFGRTERDGGRAYFVRDNGAGFDAHYAGKLFQAFQRLHTAEEFPGTGIGLATVQRVIHRHGGRVWAEGEPGHGATLFFTLPDGLEAS